MKAMILAAGLGNRMRPLTDHTPKPLLKAGDRSLIEHHLLNLCRAGVKDVVINLAYLGEKIRQYLGDGNTFGLTIHYSPEPEPLETGGAILHAAELLGDEPFLLINGDVWCDLDLSKFCEHSRKHTGTLGNLLLVPNPEFHPRGDFALSDNGLLLDDTAAPTDRKFTFAGISYLSPALITSYPNKRQKFPLVEAFRHAISNSLLSGEVFYGNWSDVGTPERLAALDNQLKQNNQPKQA